MSHHHHRHRHHHHLGISSACAYYSLNIGVQLMLYRGSKNIWDKADVSGGGGNCPCPNVEARLPNPLMEPACYPFIPKSETLRL